jgi:membrane-associated phospholipid phosphatase
MLVFLVYADAGAQLLDATALHGFNTLEGGLVQRVTFTFAYLAAPLAIVPGLPLLYWAGSRWGRRREALAGIAVVLASSATAEVVKMLSAHERFQPILGPHQVNAASFPSGTVAAVMAIVVATLVVVPNRWRMRTAAVGALTVFAAAFSVMVNLWHFPSDVLGGILVPTGYGFLAVAALRYLRQPRQYRLAARRSWRPSRKQVEAGMATVALGALAAFVVLGSRLLDYADTYTTTVVTALAISAAAAALLTLFGIAAADDS